LTTPTRRRVFASLATEVVRDLDLAGIGVVGFDENQASIVCPLEGFHAHELRARDQGLWLGRQIGSGGHQGIDGEECDRRTVWRSGNCADPLRANRQWLDSAIWQSKIELALKHEGQATVAHPGQFGNAGGLTACAAGPEMGDAPPRTAGAVPNPDIAERMTRIIPEKCQVLAIGRP
jgi:hypothetical protein